MGTHADMVLEAIAAVERLAPDNGHLYNDPTINELCEFAVNSRQTIACSLLDVIPDPHPIVVSVRPTGDAREINEVRFLVNKQGRCDRCYNPLDEMMLEDSRHTDRSAVNKTLHPVWIAGGSAVVHLNLCTDCVVELDAIVKEM